MTVTPARSPSAISLVAAFAAIYVIWGSTYFAIRVAIETIPPFLMAGLRFLLAGAVLYAWCRCRGAPAPSLRHWLSATIIGGLLLLGGNGGVVWSEQFVPSGIAALIVATVPLWLVLLNWLGPAGQRPGIAEVAGVALGFTGMILLVQMGGGEAGAPLHRLGAIVLLVATLSWSVGSLYSRRAPLPSSPLVATGMEMLAGGALLTLAGTIAGEWPRFAPGAMSVRSLTAVVYLIVFGSLVAFTAYMWLLRVTTPARVATYAYVNPIVALLLGWGFAGEPLTARTLLASAVILLGVVVTITYRGAPSATAAATAATAAASSTVLARGAFDSAPPAVCHPLDTAPEVVAAGSCNDDAA